MSTILTYIFTVIPLVMLDAFWILFVAKNFYAQKMGFLFTGPMNVVPALAFYPLYALAILLLAVVPAVTSGSWVEALWRGCILGAAAYGAYDLTNHATIPHWPLAMTLVDMLWGVVVTGLVSVIAFYLSSFAK